MKLHPIGNIRSTLRNAATAPKQGSEGTPDEWLEGDPAFAHALSGMSAGDDIIVITWLHLADRDTDAPRVGELHDHALLVGHAPFRWAGARRSLTTRSIPTSRGRPTCT